MDNMEKLFGGIIILVVGLFTYFVIHYSNEWDRRFNIYVIECEKQGGYIFDMYNNGYYCMKGEAIKIPGYDNPGLK